MICIVALLSNSPNMIQLGTQKGYFAGRQVEEWILLLRLHSHPGRSLLDTLSLLHYCGSCSKQCNNERASVSWAQPHSPQPSPCPALPLSKAPQPDGSSHSSLLLTQLVIRMITSIKVTLSQEAVFVFYSEFGCDLDGMLGQKNVLL